MFDIINDKLFLKTDLKLEGKFNDAPIQHMTNEFYDKYQKLNSLKMIESNFVFIK